MPTYTITQFKTNASQILDSLNEGEEVIITRRGKPCAKVTTISPTTEGKRSSRSLMGALATPNTPNLNQEELQALIREIRDEWKPSVYAIEEGHAR